MKNAFTCFLLRAWILWGNSIERGAEWAISSAHLTLETCRKAGKAAKAEMDRMDREISKQQPTWFFECFPDTIDPRQEKR
jgi:hypothetical protein